VEILLNLMGPLKNRIVRLNLDGTVDDFNVGAGFTGGVLVILPVKRYAMKTGQRHRQLVTK
jgi:hypothetical protein